MSPLFVRIFTLVGVALAFASMQMKARAQTVDWQQAQVQQAAAAVPAQREAARR